MGRLKTVIIVADSAQVDGGLGKVAVTSALALAAEGLRVVYFCPTRDADPRLAAAGIPVMTQNLTYAADDPNKLRGMARGLWDRRVAAELRKVLKSHDPETSIVHCHGFSKALSPAIGPIITDGQIAAVYTMHEFFLACPNGGFFDFQKAEICTRKPLGLSCLTTNCDSRRAAHKVWRVARQVVLKGPGRLPRGLRDVIYISETQRQVMTPHLGQARLHHVPNPVDFTQTDRVEAGRNALFVFVGRLEPDKGALDFARAAKAAEVKAVFVGAGRHEQAIREILPDAPITGWVGPDEVANWLGRARCLVFPSLWYECQPLVPMEALHRGLPVITGAWNAAHEVVTHGQTGLIYERPADLAQTLPKMTAELATGMSLNAYAARDQIGLSPQGHAAALRSVYDKVLS